MMSSESKVLKDDGARRNAINLHDRSILVEAGAGSGKTAIIAGRIAVMLAEGIPPRNIAAVTFTELAASELLARVREFVVDLSAGRIAAELRVALPDGLSQTQRDNLATASAAIDEITCSTIHGFCQRLIKPFPAEADIDPGASIMDPNQADLSFVEIVDGWLRERLSDDQGGILAEMVLQSPGETVALIRKIAEHLRRRRALFAPPVSPLEARVTAFRQATTDFAAFIRKSVAVESETAVVVERLTEMTAAMANGSDPTTASGLVRLLTLRPHPDLCTKAGAFASYRKKGKWTDAAKQAGLSKAEAERLNIAAQGHYTACCDAWTSLLHASARQVLAALIEEARPILERYRAHKRASAQLDFDDLIFAARDLLCDHDDVRRALGLRFAHVLVIAVADENGKASAEQQRDAEAGAVAELCARLIGSHRIADRRGGAERVCQPGDIALLAPTGAELWRYEEALERRGIPVATQAGKGLFRRQEVQELIALTRVLADRRDTLALGALLRGPLVGLTEEELLDIIWALPRSQEEPDRIPRLDLSVDPATITHPFARDAIEKLQALYRGGNSTTPHTLLSQAVDVMRVRPLLLERHRRQAERALANVDLYLSLSTGFAVRGLRAFAEAMTAAWTDEARAVEGRPDAQEEAVALFTMHAAKGLEWPIVIPVNTMTGIMSPDSAVVDRHTDTFYCPVLGVEPDGYDAARQAEKDELDRERIRLWYVAATRARELLVLPRLDVTSAKSTWISLLDLSLADLPALTVSHLPLGEAAADTGPRNTQTRELFAAEAAVIACQQAHVTWLAPSRDESVSGAILQEEESGIWMGSANEQPRNLETTITVQGGRERGLILHKLMEEILTGEIAGAAPALIERANELIRELGRSPVADPTAGLSPEELTGCVIRTLALPDIAPLRAGLLSEFPVYAAYMNDGVETATAGIADALTLTTDGRPAVVVDWKSDVNPDQQTLNHYRSQVRTYLDMTGADHGLIVLMTPGTVISVLPSARMMAA
jgi:ATP-dependent exoDNAse (exonuclease V) beta subunit